MYGINWEEADVAERKYQVGDHVRVVKGGGGGSCHDADIGSVGEITETVDGGCRRDDGWYFYIEEIEPAFAIGDRVRLRRHTDTRLCGDRGVIDDITGHGISVYMNEPFLGSRYETIPVSALNWDRDYSKETPAPDCAERKVEQDNEDKPQPKFKAGDVVGYKPGSIMGDELCTIKEVGAKYNYDEAVAYTFTDGSWDHEYNLVLVSADPAPTTRPCIVALVIDGKPQSTSHLQAHSSVEDATLEAERLARANTGQEFAVYQRVAGRVAEQHIEIKEVA